jgi:DNA-binding LytR/AlgR family response regulator
MLEIALCDDDPAITGVLETTLKAFEPLLPEPMHIQVFHQGEAVLAALKKDASGIPDTGDTGSVPFDIIFLDIELGDTTGIEVAEHIRHGTEAGAGEGPALVFVSSHESYLKQLFQFDTAAFLSKPIEAAEVQTVLLRIYKKLRNPKAVFVYSIRENMYRMPLEDILYFESKLRKIEIVTKTETAKPPARDEPSVHSFYGKLDEVEAQLLHPGFVRIHHSMLVNLDNVDRFEQGALFLGSRRLPLAHSKQKEVRRKITDYYKGIFSEAAPPNRGGGKP